MGTGRGRVEASALIVREEEQFTFDDRSAERSPKHIPTQLGLGQNSARRTSRIAVPPRVGVEDVVAEELEGIAVEAVGPRLNGGVYNSALKISELCRGVLRDDVKLLNGVRRRRESKPVLRYLVVINAVQQEVISLFTIAIDIGAPAVFCGVGTLIRARGVHG